MNRSVAWGDSRSLVSQFQWQLNNLERLFYNLLFPPWLSLESSLALWLAMLGHLSHRIQSLVWVQTSTELWTHWAAPAIYKEIIKSQHKRSASFVLFSICLENVSRTGSEFKQYKTMHLNFPHCKQNEQYCCCCSSMFLQKDHYPLAI